MPSPFLTAVVRGTGGGDPVPGYATGLTSFVQLGTDLSVFSGVGLEDAALTLFGVPTNRTKQIADRVFFFHKDTIYDLVDEAWVVSHVVTDMNSTFNHSGLYDWGDLENGEFGLCAFYQQGLATTTEATAVVYDYNTNSWAEVTSGLLSGSSQGNTLRYRSIAFYRGAFYMQAARSTDETYSFDPVSSAWGTQAVATGDISSQGLQFLVAENKLFLSVCRPTATDGAIVMQLVGGAWTRVVFIVNSYSNDVRQGQQCLYYHSGSLWLVFTGDPVAATQIHASWVEILLPSFTVVDRSAAMPSYLRTDNALAGNELHWQWKAVVDQEDILGSPRTFLLFQAEGGAQGNQLFEHVQPGDGSTAVLSDLGGSVISGAASKPDYANGGSDGIFADGELYCRLVKVAPAPNGVDLVYRFWGDPLVLEHGAVTGGPFVVGETVTGGTSLATAVVARVFPLRLWLSPAAGTFQNAELLTGGTSLATATTTAAPAGGASDKSARVRYDIGENAANTGPAQLAVPAGGLTSPMTLNVNDMETIIADGVRLYTVKHETIAQGIPNAQSLAYFAEVERP